METIEINGVVLEKDMRRTIVAQTSDYARGGIMGCYTPIYAPRQHVVSHPYVVGDRVQIGKGAVVWTVEYVGRQHVALEHVRGRKTTRKTLYYSAITRLSKVVDAAARDM